MPYLATDKDGSEWIYEEKPFKENNMRWFPSDDNRRCVELPHGSIRKLIGRDLTWEDDAYELT